MEQSKPIIYQVFTRLFGNRLNTRKEHGGLAENGCGKMNFISDDVLKRIKHLGITHIWYTGIIRHASATDYSCFGIPAQHPAVVKGLAGSPYAITDYYDVDPDLAEDVLMRQEEFSALVERTHRHGMKVIIDFVPNHVARQYRSIAKPEGVKDLGEGDDMTKSFDANNNYYYCVNEPFQPDFDLSNGSSVYTECPAKATGNDHFDPHPNRNDWYETVKLNYGVDYCDAAGRSKHFSPVPNTWHKMTDILLYWASKGIDGVRCDMAEMVPVEFWSWAIKRVKEQFPNIIFIAEIYNPNEYGNFIEAGFDFLYDKVGMYDTMRRVVTGASPTTEITRAWQWVDNYRDHMLYFIENHDEQRVASDYYAGNGKRGIPAVITNALMRQNPFMVYAGQEFGERGMDSEGFSGCDGRTTIFDYWTVETLYNAYVDRSLQTAEEQRLADEYARILRLANSEKAVVKGDFFDLMYVNEGIASHCYAFIRKCERDVLIVVTNFSDAFEEVEVLIPDHAFDFLHIPQVDYEATELLGGGTERLLFGSKKTFMARLKPNSGNVYKFNIEMQEALILNEHNKDEFPPAHTAEHLLNQTMVRMFGCERSRNAHVERKKSKISYILDHKPSRKEEKAIADKMQELIEEDLPVSYEYVKREDLPASIDLSKLPDDASETIRLVRIGDYDVCPCVGKHVRSTSQIGHFELLGTNWDELSHSFRIRFKVVQ